jgi:hypothetical protein
VRVTWRERWAGLPVWARCVLVAYAAGFADGTGAHIRDLARGGLHVYAFAPAPVQVFFVGLVLLDSLVVGLCAAACRAGAWLAGAVMAADLAANWYVNRHSLSLLPPTTGLLPITVFGLFVLASVLPLQRRLAAAASTG